MMYQLVVMNLRRRHEKFSEFARYHCTEQGVPDDHIYRFIARDGQDWKKAGWTAGDSHDELRHAAVKATGGAPYLDKAPHDYISNYCFEWTFYEALHHIANSDPNTLYFLMVDDYRLILKHDELESVLMSFDGRISDFLALQCAYVDRPDSNFVRIPVPPRPYGLNYKEMRTEFFILSVHNNFAESSDSVTLLSVDGAKMLIKRADETRHHPNGIFRLLQREGKLRGLYHTYPMWAYLDNRMHSKYLDRQAV